MRKVVYKKTEAEELEHLGWILEFQGPHCWSYVFPWV